MKEDDFGYFGTGAEGYVQYMTAFERNFDADGTTEDLPEDKSSDDSDEDF